MRNLLALVAITALGCHHEDRVATVAPPPPAPVAKPIDLKPRGEYVANVAGCVTCHGKDLAGGMEGKVEGKAGERGVWRVPNITIDRETGIGAWSDSEIVAAIRQGLRPDGAKLAAMMPYPFYHRMTDDDARALVAFIRSKPAVSKTVARTEGMPTAVANYPQPHGSVDPGDDLGHGEYLASLAHCGACHTPHDGPNAGRLFAGGNHMEDPDFGPIVAPNITSDRDTGIGAWSEDDVIRAVTEMHDPRGRKIHKPMSFYQDAWKKLTPADAKALAAFVRSVPPVVTQESDPHQVSRR